MKIDKADKVQVGDVMVIGRVTYTLGEWYEGYAYWDREPTNGVRATFTVNELQDLIDHGFEVTRKVEPVVFETTVYNFDQAQLNKTYGCGLDVFKHGQRVRVTVEPIG